MTSREVYVIPARKKNDTLDARVFRRDCGGGPHGAAESLSAVRSLGKSTMP